MKKKLAAVLAGVMVLTLGMATAFADGSLSPTVTDAYENATSNSSDAIVDSVSDTADVTYDEESDEYYLSVAVTAGDAGTELVPGETYAVYVNGVVVYGTYDGYGFTVSASELAEAGVDLEDGGTAEVVVLFEETETEDSETEDTETESEEDTTSESESAGTAESESSSTTSGGSATSDKTGAAAALPILAVAALAGVVVCGKKVKFYE